MEAAKAAKPNRTNRRGSRMDYSISPEGEKFKLPDEEDYRKEYERLFKLVERHRTEGHEIVVVMGLGFVGAVMAAVVADAVDKETGKPNKFVIGMQRPSVRSYWKIPLFNRGISPIKAEDPEVAPMIERCVNLKKTMTVGLDVVKMYTGSINFCCSVKELFPGKNSNIRNTGKLKSVE